MTLQHRREVKVWGCGYEAHKDEEGLNETFWEEQDYNVLKGSLWATIVSPGSRDKETN